mmetsp:Transcript_54246/g.170563  ORF Transcript_54246/g.170563 Transcript_54246/m.170563 type:complete len:533 (+) Transcript_54246:3-1601(+)
MYVHTARRLTSRAGGRSAGHGVEGRAGRLRQLPFAEPAPLEALARVPAGVLPRAVAPVPKEPAVGGLAVSLQLGSSEGQKRGVLLVRVVAVAHGWGQCEAPLANNRWHAAQDLAVALRHPQMASQALALPPGAEAVVHVQVKRNVRMPDEAVVSPGPESPDLVQALRAEDGERHGDLVRWHPALADRAHRTIVVVAESLRGHPLAGLVAHRDASDAWVAPVARGEGPQRRDGLVHAPVLPLPVAALTAAGLLAALAPRRAVEVQQHLQAAGLAPGQRLVQVLQSGACEGLAGRGACDDPVPKRNSNGVEAQCAYAAEVLLRDVALAVCAQRRLRGLVAEPLAHPGHQVPLAAGRAILLEELGAGAWLEDEPAAEVDTAPRRPAPEQAPLVRQKACQTPGGFAEICGHLAPVGRGGDGHGADAADDLRSSQTLPRAAQLLERHIECPARLVRPFLALRSLAEVALALALAGLAASECRKGIAGRLQSSLQAAGRRGRVRLRIRRCHWLRSLCLGVGPHGPGDSLADVVWDQRV